VYQLEVECSYANQTQVLPVFIATVATSAVTSSHVSPVSGFSQVKVAPGRKISVGDEDGMVGGDLVGAPIGLADGVPDGRTEIELDVVAVGVPDGAELYVPDGETVGVPGGLEDGASAGVVVGVPVGGRVFVCESNSTV
jgi:hypothetical protein